jgi:hypothetical protein
MKFEELHSFIYDKSPITNFSNELYDYILSDNYTSYRNFALQFNGNLTPVQNTNKHKVPFVQNQNQGKTQNNQVNINKNDKTMVKAEQGIRKKYNGDTSNPGYASDMQKMQASVNTSRQKQSNKPVQQSTNSTPTNTQLNTQSPNNYKTNNQRFGLARKAFNGLARIGSGVINAPGNISDARKGISAYMNLRKAKKYSGRGDYQRAMQYMGKAAKTAVNTNRFRSNVNQYTGGVNNFITDNFGKNQVTKFITNTISNVPRNGLNTVINGVVNAFQHSVPDYQSALYDEVNFGLINKVKTTARAIGKVASMPEAAFNKVSNSINKAKGVAYKAGDFVGTMRDPVGATAKVIKGADKVVNTVTNKTMNKNHSYSKLDYIKVMRDITFASLKYEGHEYWLIVINGKQANLRGPYDRSKQLEKDALEAKVLGHDIKIFDSQFEAEEFMKNYEDINDNGTPKLHLIRESTTRNAGGLLIDQGKTKSKVFSFSEGASRYDEEGFPIPNVLEDMNEKYKPTVDWYVVKSMNKSDTIGPITEVEAINLFKELEAKPHNEMIRLIHGEDDLNKYFSGIDPDEPWDPLAYLLG